MTTFTDKLGRDWEIDLTLLHARRFLAQQKINLLTASEEEMQRLLDEPSLGMVLVWIAIEETAKSQEIDLEQWLGGMNSAAISQAQAALWSAMGLFFLTSPTCLERWDGLLKRLAGTTDHSPTGTPGTGSTASAESSDATGAPSASAN